MLDPEHRGRAVPRSRQHRLCVLFVRQPPSSRSIGSSVASSPPKRRQRGCFLTVTSAAWPARPRRDPWRPAAGSPGAAHRRRVRTPSPRRRARRGDSPAGSRVPSRRSQRRTWASPRSGGSPAARSRPPPRAGSRRHRRSAPAPPSSPGPTAPRPRSSPHRPRRRHTRRQA